MGQDTLVVQGNALTTIQRNDIFVTTSIETILDANGTDRAGVNDGPVVAIPLADATVLEDTEW